MTFLGIVTSLLILLFLGGVVVCVMGMCGKNKSTKDK